MPKNKNTKHVKTIGKTKRARGSDSEKLETIVAHFRCVDIGVKNAKRWLSLKKRLGFSSDDDLAVHLLDLADNNVRQNEKCCTVEKEKKNRDEGKNSRIGYNQVGAGSRRSPRKQFHSLPDEKISRDADLQSKECKILEINIVNQQKGGYKSKHHRSKTKHHKDKRKKKNYMKNSEVDDVNINSNDNITNGGEADKIHEQKLTSLSKPFDDACIVKPIKLDVELTNIRGTRDESVIQKTEKIDNVVLMNNLDSEENRNDISPINDEREKEGEEEEGEEEEEEEQQQQQQQQQQKQQQQQQGGEGLIDYENSNVEVNRSNSSKNSSSQCFIVKHVSNTVFEVTNKVAVHKKLQQTNDSQPKQEQHHEGVDNYSHDVISDTDGSKILYDSKMKSNNADVKKSKRKRKHLQNETANPVENGTISETIVSQPVYKHRKKKHKQTNEHKNRKNHDVRKAPQDGMIPIEMRDLQLDVSETVNPTASNSFQVELDNDESTLGPQRLAIKIKLCQDCNNRHIQGACPLMSATYEISDVLSYGEWLSRHKHKEEVMKAVTIEDPMSDGYGKVIDDGVESDDESASDQYQSKAKVQREEKLLQVDNERPLFARASLPNCLQLKMTNTDHGLGIYAKHAVPMYARLGPLIGTAVKEMDIPDDFSMRHIWEIENDSKTSYISTTNPLKSNWVRYMRPAETKEERTVAVITKNGDLYFVTTQNIAAGGELTYWAESSSFTWTRKNKADKTNCGGCNLTFTHTIYYRLHCCIFHDTNYSLTIRKYHCKVCGAAVLGKDNIMKHAAELHAGRGAYQCQYCRKFFLRLNYLEMHRTYGCAQNPQRTRPLCDFCGHKFCQPQKLKVHIKRMHSDMSEVLREFQCKLCLKLLGSRAALQRHMKEVHHKDVVAAATCDRCGKMFQNKSNLKIHMLTHSGVKPFKCKECACKAAFTTKQCLQFHYKKVHGLTEEMMPKIERSVAYTFDAYSGGLIEDNDSSKTPRSTLQDCQDEASDMTSLDDCSSENNLKTNVSDESLQLPTQIEPSQCDLDSLNNGLSHESPRDSSLQQHLAHVNETLDSSLTDLRADHDLCITSRIQSKGSKKWMGEFNPSAITKMAEHSQHNINVNSTDVYEFEENIKNDNGRSSPLPIASSLIEESKHALSVYRRTESTNASLLVEAALDAAERDIGTVSSPMLGSNDRDGNIYSISNQLQSPLPSRSPESHLETYIQHQDLMSPVPTPDNRQPSSPIHIHTDYHSHRAIDYINTTRTHNIEQYLHHDDLQRGSPPANYMHMSQGDLSALSTTPNARYSDAHHHHHHHHHHHRVPTENLSSDEGDSVAQNLSISAKEKALQMDLTTSYKYDSLDLEFGNRERGNFEPLVLNNGELQGLDMSARGFHTFGPQTQNNRYQHHMYEITERQSVDLSRTGAYSISPPPPYPHNDLLRVVSLDLTPGGRHSVDLSLSRSHHLHGTNSRLVTSPRPACSTTPHIVPEMNEGRMISSSSPPPLSSYNPAYPSSPAPYHPPRPGYHHYSGYY